ncbi:MAG: SDR family oxidoreductase [Bacteroidales bacterium]|jgi:NAD(P)-dependent dehydrogenase (short-subunit alcohol dehydrogenase family)|nr:SDR family oxidoreductase [Bacteroidales bacterium]
MNIIVNGGTRGIGRELVLLLAKDPGNRILATGRDSKALKRLSSGAVNGNITGITLDMAFIDQQAKGFLKSVSACMKRVDILVNMAGSLVVEDFMKFSTAKARELMEINFFGPASLIRALRPLMRKGSHIVNISSMGGYQGSSKYRGLSYYSASKAAIACLSECLAEEFRDSGIAVNCLALGAVETSMFKEAFPGHTAPVKPGEMAGFIAGFAINGNRFFSGKVLPVAGSNP